MRARLIAVLILILLVGWPSYLYWYFYKKNISSLVFLSDSNESYTVSLEGKLEYKYFPLLDDVFRYKSTCMESCIFTPIPPIRYTLHISTTGREDIMDTIDLTTWETKKYPVILPKVLFTEKIWKMASTSAPVTLPWVTPIGITSWWKSVAFTSDKDGGEVWIINNNQFLTLFRSQKSLESAYLDETRSFVIVPDSAAKQAIYSLDGRNQGTVFPNLEKILMVTTTDWLEWKVQTEQALYESEGWFWKKNIRFTDFIDLGPRYRLAFLRKTQKEKFELQNIAVGTSLIVLLDRVSNEMTILRKGYEILWFFQVNGAPALLDTKGDFYRIELRGSLKQ